MFNFFLSVSYYGKGKINFEMISFGTFDSFTAGNNRIYTYFVYIYISYLETSEFEIIKQNHALILWEISYCWTQFFIWVQNSVSSVGRLILFS